jgi:hypothetical protein
MTRAFGSASKPTPVLTEPGFASRIWTTSGIARSSTTALSRDVLGRSVSHTLLIHYNLLNSMFLGDLLAMFRSRGWAVTDAEEAFKDEVFKLQPDIAPAGESLIWALAKETGRFEDRLRYPGEDDTYEKPTLDRLGL